MRDIHRNMRSCGERTNRRPPRGPARGTGSPGARRIGYTRHPPARVAQLDRALASGAKGRRFESCRAYHYPDVRTRCFLWKRRVRNVSNGATRNGCPVCVSEDFSQRALDGSRKGRSVRGPEVRLRLDLDLLHGRHADDPFDIGPLNKNCGDDIEGTWMIHVISVQPGQDLALCFRESFFNCGILSAVRSAVPILQILFVFLNDLR